MRPFGFEIDRHTLRPREAELLREAAKMLIDGATLRSVTAWINDQDVTTPGGNRFQPVVLKRSLISPRIAGKVPIGNDEYVDAGWEAILDEDTWKQVRDALSGNVARADANSPRSYLLTGGMARCSLCGSPLVARRNNNSRRGYVCVGGPPTFGCGKIRITADLVDKDVAERVLARLHRDGARQMVGAAIGAAKDTAATAPARIAEAEERLRELAVAYADGKISMNELTAARERLQEQIKQARLDVRIVADQGSITEAFMADDIVRWWEEASLDAQRALLDILVTSVVVHPVVLRGSKIYDPARVEVQWRTVAE